MRGAERRGIKANGRAYQIRNATDANTDLELPGYSDDGELVGVLERRNTPDVDTSSKGDEIVTDLQLRAVYDSSQTTIREATADDWPTKLVHPNGDVYRVRVTLREDRDVTVLSLERE
jgi:hypothetical protein